jgi:NADPH-dependent glutamate synthase beta subunit-like oxidoreductase/ferredoxin
MIEFEIDGEKVQANEGEFVLNAARDAGIEMPSMCYQKGHAPQNSCLTCVVKVNGNPNLVPSCSRPVEDGMVIESKTAEVEEVRKTALELILSDHVGDCYAPCASVCPAHMEIPQMLRQVGDGDYKAAIKTIKRDIPFPGIMGRVCPEVCEGGCRRGSFDTYESICMVERFCADENMKAEVPWVPEIAAAKNKKVVIVGAGLSGLSAAYYLGLMGYSCTIIEKTNVLGGSLRKSYGEKDLPANIYDYEFSIFKNLESDFKYNTELGVDMSIQDLEDQYDAVFICIGITDDDVMKDLGLETKAKRPVVNKQTLQSNRKKVFIGGVMVHKNKMNIFSIAAGKNASVSIDQFLSAKPLVGREKRFNSRSGKLKRDQIDTMMESTINREDRYSPDEKSGTHFSDLEKVGFNPTQAKSESDRCLHCDCRAKDHCDLRDQSEFFDAKQNHYSGKMRPIAQLNEGEKLHLDSGKCLQCGICVQITIDAKEEIGLAYRGRGFDTSIVVPFDQPLHKAMAKSANECIKACPTGAIEYKGEPATVENPFDLMKINE